MAENPTLWEQPGQAQKILKERNKLQQALNNYQQLKNQLADNIGLIELAEQENEADILQEAEKSLVDLQEIARKRKLESLLSGEADGNDCYLGSCRCRRYGGTGLGRIGIAHVFKMGRTAWL